MRGYTDGQHQIEQHVAVDWRGGRQKGLLLTMPDSNNHVHVRRRMQLPTKTHSQTRLVITAEKELGIDNVTTVSGGVMFTLHRWV